MPTQPSRMSPQQANSLARQLVLGSGVEMTQQIYNQGFAGARLDGQVINVQPRNVGLVKGFIVEITLTIANTSGATDSTLTDFGGANALAQISFTDLQNNQRINTTGWHLAFLNAVNFRRPWGSALVAATGFDDGGVGFGDNWSIDSADTTIPKTTGTGTVVKRYYVPLAYSDVDLRGAIYLNVVNATANLSLTLGTSGTSATDTTAAMYSGPATADSNITNAQVSVYQVYLDQLPVGQNGVVLPMLDLATIYEMKNTVFTAMQVNSEFPVAYPNFRDFLSTIAVYYNGATREVGSDVNYWALQAANFTNIFKKSPQLVALTTRNIIGTDMPKGVNYFSFKRRPISTIQYGNMELILNAATAGATAYLGVGWEDFGYMNQLTGAGSLPAA